jgi:signal transduction histidine kinase/FixJ family two-component response regulator
MKTWRKKREEEANTSSVARAALAGASHEELLREALKTLTPNVSADRIGAWLVPDSTPGRIHEFSPAFQGLVWDSAGQDCPREWMNLSLEPPLPEELLIGEKPIELNLEASPENTVIGQLVGLRHAMWIPVASRHQVKGLILVGSKGKPLSDAHERAGSVAAELALALELEDQQSFARVRNADLTLTRHFLETSSGDGSIETLLANLAADCTTATANGSGPGAAFAVIGALQDRHGTSGQTGEVAFRWRSGDEQWTRAVESEPLATVWRRALEARRVIGSEPPSAWAKTSVSRIVAYPLEAQGQLLGTLVAGLPGVATSLATLDRLDLRALLAASLLEKRKRLDVESQRARCQEELLDLLSEPLLLMDASGRISASSRGARELLRPAVTARESRPAGALPSEHLSGLFFGRDQERVQQWLRDTIQSCASTPTAEKQPPQAQLHNGINVRLYLARPVPGQLAAILLQPLIANESARQSDHAEAELQNVIEWLEEGVVLFDAGENVRAMNTRFEQIMGLAPEQSGKIKSLEGLIAHLEGQAAEPGRFAARWRALARGIEGGVREELQMVRPAPRILERAARPVLDSIGRQLGRVEIYRDLTAQRVFQSRLLQTEKLAALGQMVSGIAHELSNPLTTILGYAQRLLIRPDAAARSEEVRQIFQEAERATAILRQLLLNARETLPERRLVSLNQIAMRATELQRFSLAAEKIRVETDLDPALPLVQGDSGQLQQVLMNLLGNAQQALEQQGQGGFIRLRTRRIGERRVLLEVEDNGPGIPQAIQARIFDPFFTTKPPGVGTGLGLSIVLSVVREHGGQVHVISPPQGGAKFQIEMPAASERQQAEALTLVAPEKKTARQDAVPFAGAAERRAAPFESREVPRVLVVEDEPTVARLIADVLEDEGMQVDVLLDGREALDRAACQSYDLVICDVKMPGLDGQHFHKSLQRRGNPLRDRFLFVTGDVIAAQTREFLERNRLPHVAKPFRVEELTEKVREVLQVRARQGRTQTEAARKNAARNG